jgi:hypothetical protein
MLRERFDIKALAVASWMLGMRITRDRDARTITLDQQQYIDTALKRFGLEQCKSLSTPEAVGARDDTNTALDVPADKQRYMELTGTLQYAATGTRPDICHAVHYLTSNMSAPTVRHMQAAERVLRYLAGTKEVGLVFGSRTPVAERLQEPTTMTCSAFADADWAGDKSDRKSTTGWVAMVNGDPISWRCKKQTVVALSTCEAELYAEAAAIQEVQWIRGALAELGLNAPGASMISGDNQSTITISKNGVKTERTKHVDVKYHFVTNAINDQQIELQWVPTAQQQADIFTKALHQPAFVTFRKLLMSQ